MMKSRVRDGVDEAEQETERRSQQVRRRQIGAVERCWKDDEGQVSQSARPVKSSGRNHRKRACARLVYD